MVKRKYAALLLSILLLLQLACPQAQATGVYFVGAEENILPLTDETMPFWHNGYLYIAGSVFTGMTRESLKVSHVSTLGGMRVILYRNEEHLIYEAGVAYARDENGDIHYPGAVMRDDTLFVPVSMVASYFDLEYSVTSVRYGFLVWLRQLGFGLSASQFADAASASIQDRYNDYLRVYGGQGQNQQPDVSDPTEGEGDGKRLYLCMKAKENAGNIMDTLERYHAYGTFFCTPEFLEENDGLLRRMVGSGHSVGILADGENGRDSVLEQLRAGNRALEQATGQKTRLARVENGDADTLENVQAAGYCLSATALEPVRFTLESVSQANALFQSISAPQGKPGVWLDTAVRSDGLARFLSLAAEKEDLCLALTETAQIS